MNKKWAWAVSVAATVVISGVIISAQFTGQSTTQSSYVLPTLPIVKTQSLLSVGDAIGGYRMVGIPDGLGAFDNGDNTFTLLMNHELGNTLGIKRAHESVGAFVSKWTIDKKTMAVLSGADLMQQIFPWDSATQSSLATPATIAFNRFCSGDLRHLGNSRRWP